jgi:predicted lipoprotein with Yx(FWY)xxD motif/plastocyanin
MAVLSSTRARLVALLALALVGVAALAPQTTSAQTSQVSIVDFNFQPGTVTVPVGTTITWTNHGQTGHTTTSDSGAWDSSTLQPGQTFQFTFNQPGTFTYHCKIHPFMTGSITVQQASGTAQPTVGPTSTGTTATTSGLPVQVTSNATLGAILTNAQGMTLYYLTSENSTTFKCTGACLNNWPPLLLPAGVTAPTAGTGVTGTLGVAMRPDGSQQVTYNGEPLYTFIGDKAPGDTHGEGINAFGGTWHAAQVNNTPLAARPATLLTVHITKAAGTVWGTVSLRYSLAGKHFSATCSHGTCRLFVPQRATIHLTQKPTNAQTWPFQAWKVRASGGHTRVLKGQRLNVSMKHPMIVHATYATGGYSR